MADLWDGHYALSFGYTKEEQSKLSISSAICFPQICRWITDSVFAKIDSFVTTCGMNTMELQGNESRLGHSGFTECCSGWFKETSSPQLVSGSSKLQTENQTDSFSDHTISKLEPHSDNPSHVSSSSIAVEQQACESTFCGEHCSPEKHECSFDFKGVGHDAIAKANLVVKADKVNRV
ncbi:hypothetical protein V6N12_001273 [Hibiscus sabdariffa]|uniref:Uncharacterized protein n=1 Tax=Hibiscus sabdariffa TaxID=183260 RepID=A0ABR2C7G1_9ROSI